MISYIQTIYLLTPILILPLTVKLLCDRNGKEGRWHKLKRGWTVSSSCLSADLRATYWYFQPKFPLAITFVVKRLSLLFRRGNWGSERLGNFFKVTQLVSAKMRFKLRQFFTLFPTLNVIVSSCIVGTPVPVGVSIYVSSIEQISEVTMVSVSAPALGRGTRYMRQGAGS